MNSYIENHPLMTDRKLYLHFPFLKINFSDSMYSLFDLVNLLNLNTE